MRKRGLINQGHLGFSVSKAAELGRVEAEQGGRWGGGEGGEGQKARENQSGEERSGLGHSQWGVPDAESLQIATIKARLPGDIGTLGQGHHGHIGDYVGAGAWVEGWGEGLWSGP